MAFDNTINTDANSFIISISSSDAEKNQLKNHYILDREAAKEAGGTGGGLSESDSSNIESIKNAVGSQLGIDITMPTTPYQKSVKVTPTASAVDTTTALKSGATIKAYSDNTHSVYIGTSSGVTTSGTTRGHELQAGESAPIIIKDLSQIYAIAAASTNAISILGS